MNAERNKEIIQIFFKEVLNNHDLSKLGDFISSQYIEHGFFGAQGLGISGVRTHIEQFFEAFADLSYTIEDLIAEEDKVVARWTMRGRHIGTFFGKRGSGKSIITTGIDIYQMEDGKIIEHWHEIDLLRLQQEIS